MFTFLEEMYDEKNSMESDLISNTFMDGVSGRNRGSTRRIFV